MCMDDDDDMTTACFKVAIAVGGSEVGRDNEQRGRSQCGDWLLLHLILTSEAGSVYQMINPRTAATDSMRRRERERFFLQSGCAASKRPMAADNGPTG